MSQQLLALMLSILAHPVLESENTNKLLAIMPVCEYVAYTIIMDTPTRKIGVTTCVATTWHTMATC